MSVNLVLVSFAVVAVLALLGFAIVGVTAARRRQASAAGGGMAISVFPRGSLGWWSVGLAVAFVLALVVVSVLPGNDPLDADSNQARALALKIVFIILSGTSFVAGFISLIRRKELSVLVLVGMLITLWLGLITMVTGLFIE